MYCTQKISYFSLSKTIGYLIGYRSLDCQLIDLNWQSREICFMTYIVINTRSFITSGGICMLKF